MFKSCASRGNLVAAIQSCKVKVTDKPELKHIIFHRDSDIYDGDEPDKDRVERGIRLLNAPGNVKHQLFLTSGYDVEAYFLNPEHINALDPGISIVEAEKLINEATTETRDKSLDKLLGQIEKYRREAVDNNQFNEFSYTKTIKLLTQKYDSNPERYGYGKTVLGRLIDKLRSKKSKIDILHNSNKIIIPSLVELLVED